MAFEVIMPNLGAASESSALLRWLVREGDEVRRGEMLFEAESDKAVVEIEAGESGQLLPLVEPGTRVEAGQVIGVLLAPGETYSGEPASAEAAVSETVYAEEDGTVEPASGAEHSGRIVITPFARKLAARKGIDVSRIRGSGPHGRIVEADVRAAMGASPAERIVDP